MRVIVDENAGPGTAVWEQFQRAFGGEQCEYVFLAKTHCGIPDVEIQLTRTRSNEVTSLDFDRIATCLLAAELTESPALPT
ncbi:MAG: hypothetical protein ACC655_00845 [Rhodothermia bacterium]